MEIIKADIWEIPYDWAQELAEECDPDWSLHYGDAYDAIRAAWPECSGRVSEMLYQLTALEECD